MDDYLNIYEYIGDEQQEYSTATNVNKEEHEMVKKTPQKVHQPTQINQCSTDTRETQDQNNIKNAPKATKRCTILMAVLIAVILLISLAAIVLSAVLYNVSNSEKTDLRAQGANTSNAFNKDMEFTLNNTLLQLKNEQNMIHHSVIQSRIDINLLISQFTDNISKLSIQLDAVNNDVKSVATTVESNISQLHIQLDAVNKLAISVKAEVIRIHCGSGEWHRVAYLNMTDPSQQCPPTWREYSSNNIRVCGRVFNTEGSCSSTSFPMTSGPYNRVCGRVVGYQVASPDAFQRYADNGIDLDGINITHGAQHHHIWSYVAGETERSSRHMRSNCPCSTVAGTEPQSLNFVGDRNYYCESGNPTDTFADNQLYFNDPLWDGQQCEGTCCNGTNSPPWFSIQLPAPTSDRIEVSICADESTDNEDTPIALLEIYVQ